MNIPQAELLNIANQLNAASAKHKAQANRIRNLAGGSNSNPAMGPLIALVGVMSIMTIAGLFNIGGKQ